MNRSTAPNSLLQAAPDPVPSPRRRSLLCDTEVQFALLQRIVLHWAAFFACNAIALTIWVRLFKQPEAGWGKSFTDALVEFMPFYLVSAALLPAFVWDTLKLSNRFAGPIVRLRRSLAEAREGRVVKALHFRDSDFWQQIATDLNSILRSTGQLAGEPNAEPATDSNDAGDSDDAGDSPRLHNRQA